MTEGRNGNGKGPFVEIREEIKRWKSDFQGPVCRLLYYTNGPEALGHFSFSQPYFWEKYRMEHAFRRKGSRPSKMYRFIEAFKLLCILGSQSFFYIMSPSFLIEYLVLFFFYKEVGNILYWQHYYNRISKGHCYYWHEANRYRNVQRSFTTCPQG